MSPIMLGAAGLSLLIWTILVLFRGGFWRANQFLSPLTAPLETPPEIVAIIPARNEAMTIGKTIDSLLAQDYAGKFSIIVVNDNSEDDTGNIAKAAGRGNDAVKIVEGTAPPEGWTGKMWAVAQGIEAANTHTPQASYFLLTDADILHHPENLSELTAKALEDKLALVSLMVRLRCASAWERLLIPAFIFFFQKLYPFPWVNDRTKQMAAAAGGCMLVERNTLEKTGSIAAIKNQIIDDCALARQLKKSKPIWLGLTRATLSLRSCDNLSDIWHMVCRTAFVQLNYSALQLLGTVLGMIILYAMPVLALFAGFFLQNDILMAFGVAAWVLMGVTYAPTLQLYRRSTGEACLLPLAALLYTAMTIDSARQYWIGKAPSWKGRPNIR